MSLLNLSRKVLFTFFPAKALFGWTMLDPPCAPWGDDLPAGRAGAFGLVPRPNIYPNVITYQGTPRMPIAAIASNCVKLSRTTWINMNQYESKNAFGICCAGVSVTFWWNTGRGHAMLWIMQWMFVSRCGWSPRWCGQVPTLSLIIRIKLRHVTTLKGYFFVILSCSLLVNASIRFSSFHTAFGLFFQVTMFFLNFRLGPVISSHLGRSETPDDDGPLPSHLVWTVNGQDFMFLG